MLTSAESLPPGDLERVVAECPADPGTAEHAVPFLRFERMCNAFFSDAQNDKENANLGSNSITPDSIAESTSSGKPGPNSGARSNANPTNGSSMGTAHVSTETGANADVDATLNAAADTAKE